MITYLNSHNNYLINHTAWLVRLKKMPYTTKNIFFDKQKALIYRDNLNNEDDYKNYYEVHEIKITSTELLDNVIYTDPSF